MVYVLIRQSLFVRINHSDELSVWRIKHSQLYKGHLAHILLEWIILLRWTGWNNYFFNNK